MDKICLTVFSEAGGCGGKIGPGDLDALLAGHTCAGLDDGVVLLGNAWHEDAAVLQRSDGMLSVNSIDFITPIVDDPRTFGAIAATAALSDIYTVGGRPEHALCVLAWPREIPVEAASEALAGLRDVLGRAGAQLVGGHTIRNSQPLIGASISGSVAPGGLIRPSDSRAGWSLWTNKRLGTGLLARSFKQDHAFPESLYKELVTECLRLNDVGLRMGSLAGRIAMTDISGFGLVGALRTLCDRGNLSAVIERTALPLLPGVFELIAAGLQTGGGRANRKFLEGRTAGLDEATAAIVFDPQTSGGLLAAIDPASEREAASLLGSEAVRIGYLNPTGEGVLARFV